MCVRCGKEELRNCLGNQHRCLGPNLTLWESRDLWSESRALIPRDQWILVCLSVDCTVPSSKCSPSRKLWTSPALPHSRLKHHFSINLQKHIRHSKKFHYLLSVWFWECPFPPSFLLSFFSFVKVSCTLLHNMTSRRCTQLRVRTLVSFTCLSNDARLLHLWSV